MTKLKVLILVPLLVVMTACQPIEVSARDGIASAKGFIEDQQKQHLAECQADTTKPVCGAINQAVAAQNLLINALDLYCSDTAFETNNGPCHPNKEAEPKLREAIRNMQSTIDFIKKMLGKK